jgi:HD superfamily phosphohydrolase YqeK
MSAPGLPPWAEVSPKRLAHIQRVADLAGRWADALDVSADERARWLRAVWLHDALRDAEESDLRWLAPDFEGPVELIHGPAAARRAAQEGEPDLGVLAAVRWHSFGSPEWDTVGRVLYCADYLEPGRNHDPEGRARLAAEYPTDPDAVLREVALRRITWLVRSGWPIPEITWRFWNHLAGGR